MTRQEFTTPRERKMKFAEAGVLFVLVLALTIFVGVKVATRGDEDIVTPEPVVAITEITSETVEQISKDEPVVTVEAEHPAEVAAEPEALDVETVEREIITYAEAEKAYFDRRYEEAADMFNLYTDESSGQRLGILHARSERVEVRRP